MMRKLTLVTPLLAVALNVATTAIAQNGPYYATPSWDQQVPASTRFIVLANWIDTAFPSGGAAVLDRETGLVWERSPTSASIFDWDTANESCRKQITGNRRGWRLPSYEELTSLLDPSESNPALPAGHPFLGIGGFDNFWTSSTEEGTPTNGWFVEIVSADTWIVADKSFTFRIWCVRGGSAVANPSS